MNVLLREPGTNTNNVAEIRAWLSRSLKLASIDEHRKELGCREGLLIDLDYGADLLEDASGNDGATSNPLTHMHSGTWTVCLFRLDTCPSVLRLYRVPLLSFQSSCFFLVSPIALPMIWNHYSMFSFSSALTSRVRKMWQGILPFTVLVPGTIVPPLGFGWTRQPTFPNLDP